MTTWTLIFWLLTAFSIGLAVGPFCVLPFVPREHRKEALKIILRPWRKLKGGQD